MFNTINNYENFAPRGGLYRVWIRAHEGEQAPLVSIWIDPAMTAFEPRGAKEAYNSTVGSAVATSDDSHAGASGLIYRQA